MLTDDHWITMRITEARRRHVLVTDAVASRMAEMLKGQLTAHQLSPKDLTSVAKMLIAEMVPITPKADAER